MHKRSKNGRFAQTKRTTKLALLALLTLTATYYTGGALNSTHTVEAQTITVPAQFPVLDRIANCESHGHQFAPSGQVLMKPNTNHTVDVGLYQINTVWFVQATKLGFDLTTEQGNRDMAQWIYTNKGTAPWYSSAHCWNK